MLLVCSGIDAQAACRNAGENCNAFRRCCGGLSCGPLGNTRCFHSPRREGEPCSAFNRCDSGLCCNGSSRCEVSGGSGETCASCPTNACEDGLSCGPITESPRRCYSTPRQLGEPCSSTACAAGLSCGPIGDRVCYDSPRQRGQPCSAFNPCGGGLCCSSGGLCIDSGDAGEPCSACAVRACDGGLSCGPVTESPRRCYGVPRDLGEPCSSTGCGAGLSCGPVTNRVCFHSPRREGEPCASSACAGGLCCGGDLTCKREAGDGDPCACPLRGDGGCEDGFSCGPGSDDPRLCYPSPRQLGDPCSVFNTCANGLSCGPVGDQHCYHEPRIEDEPCASDGACRADLYCDNLLSVVGTCRPRPGLGEGCSASEPCIDGLSCGPVHDRKCYNVPREYAEPCSVFNPCGDGLTCHPGVQRCYTAPRQHGEPCSLGFACADGLTCHPGVQRCFNSPREFEEPCSLGFACGDGLSCQPGVQRCYHSPRRFEEPCSLGFECGDCLSCAPGVHRCYSVPRGPGEPCGPVNPCGDEGFFCHPLLLRCVPVEAADPTDIDFCAGLYDAGLAQAAIELGAAVGYSLGGAAAAGLAVSAEQGVVYGPDGECGCFTATCIGGEAAADVEVFTAVAVVPNWGDFAGASLVVASGADVFLGFTAGVILSADGSNVLGSVTSYSIGVGGSLFELGVARCNTVLSEVPPDRIPDPAPRCGCGDVDAEDADDDGYPDCVDSCPDDPDMVAPSGCRDCGEAPVDRDGDGIEDCEDDCPDDGAKTEAGVCGCGVSDDDGDDDGTPDCNDECPNVPTVTVADACGCSPPQVDRDGDGVLDCRDGCPDDSQKIAPGACGCGVPEAAVCADLCPNDDSKVAPGVCGCGAPDPVGSHAPTIACFDGEGECAGELTTVSTAALATDRCGGALTPVTQADDRFPAGQSSVTWGATDEAGNSASCDAAVFVVDTTAPALSCPAAVTVEADTACIGLANPNATATELCQAFELARAPAQTMWSLGSHVVTHTATDGSGNVARCESTVTVVDATSPVAVAGDDIGDLEADAACRIAVALDGSASSDNCGVASYAWSEAGVPVGAVAEPTVTLEGVGAHTLDLRVCDGSGNCDDDALTVEVATSRMACFGVRHASVRLGSRRGKLQVRGRFQPSACTAIDLAAGARVSVDDASFVVPAGGFRQRAHDAVYNGDGWRLVVDLRHGDWRLDMRAGDTSGLTPSDGLSVEIQLDRQVDREHVATVAGRRGRAARWTYQATGRPRCLERRWSARSTSASAPAASMVANPDSARQPAVFTRRGAP